MYLLDTNICIFAIKRKPAEVFTLIKDRTKDGIYISSLTVAELEFGVQNSEREEKNRIALLKFLSIQPLSKLTNFESGPTFRLF